MLFHTHKNKTLGFVLEINVYSVVIYRPAIVALFGITPLLYHHAHVTTLLKLDIYSMQAILLTESWNLKCNVCFGETIGLPTEL